MAKKKTTITIKGYTGGDFLIMLSILIISAISNVLLGFEPTAVFLLALIYIAVLKIKRRLN